MPSSASRVSAPPPTTGRKLWLWVAAGFLLLAIAWSVMFVAASLAKIESVPLATKGGR